MTVGLRAGPSDRSQVREASLRKNNLKGNWPDHTSEFPWQAPWHIPVPEKPDEVERGDVVSILQLNQLRHRHSPGLSRGCSAGRGQGPGRDRTSQMGRPKMPSPQFTGYSLCLHYRDPGDQGLHRGIPFGGPPLIFPAGGNNLHFSTGCRRMGSSCLGLKQIHHSACPRKML